MTLYDKKVKHKVSLIGRFISAIYRLRNPGKISRAEIEEMFRQAGEFKVVEYRAEVQAEVKNRDPGNGFRFSQIRER